MIILVTGASGFVGRHLVHTLRTAGHLVRTAGFASNSALDFRIALAPDADWSIAVTGCDAVIHAGGRAHVFNKTVARSAATFDDVNITGTLALAKAAAQARVRHFVFISSIAAAGDTGTSVIREIDAPNPNTAYGGSKLAAERGLAQMYDDTGLALTCLRPPLIYGADAGGRFRQMLRWCDLRLPLPFAAIDNQRSYLAVENLVDAAGVCLAGGTAAAGTYNIADAETVSTPDLLRLIGTGLGKPARLFAVPPLMLDAMRGLGLAQPLAKLSQSLVLDTSAFARAMGWTPPVTLHDGIVGAARAYRHSA